MQQFSKGGPGKVRSPRPLQEVPKGKTIYTNIETCLTFFIHSLTSVQ